LFSLPGTCHAMAFVVRGGEKTAAAHKIAAIRASPPASTEGRAMQH